MLILKYIILTLLVGALALFDVLMAVKIWEEKDGDKA